MKQLLKDFLHGAIFAFWAFIIIAMAVGAYTYCLCKTYDNDVKIQQLKEKP